MRVYGVPLLAVLLSLLGANVRAEEVRSQDRHLLAEKYAASLELAQSIEEHLDLMMTLSWPSMQANTPEFSSDEGHVVVEKVMKDVKANYTRKILNKITDEYAQMYSVSELTALLNFSESAEGRSIWAKRKLRDEVDRNAFRMAYDYEYDFKRVACEKLKCKTK
jgi:hypothetical protein